MSRRIPLPREDSTTSPPDGHWATSSDAELWQHLVDRGVPQDQANRHILIRRQATVGNLPENIKRELDPGALASFGLGTVDMASFGVGDQVARALEPEAELTQRLAGELHPTAHLLGEVTGLLSPLALEKILTLAGVRIAPTAIGAAVRGIKNVAGRAAAKTALNAAIGAGYAGAQAAGRTEGGLAPRLAAVKQAVPAGAAAGVLAPWVAASLGAAGSKVIGPIVKRVAGPTTEVPAARGLVNPRVVESLKQRIAEPLGGPLDDLVKAERDFAAGKLT